MKKKKKKKALVQGGFMVAFKNTLSGHPTQVFLEPV